MSTFVAGIVIGLVGTVTSLVSTLVTKRFEFKTAQLAAHGDRLREATLEMVKTATRVGEGDAAAHSDVRACYASLLLTSQTEEVQLAARKLVRTTYNVAEGLQDRPRRPAPAGLEHYPAIEVRHAVRALLSAVRVELGVTSPLVDELSD